MTVRYDEARFREAFWSRVSRGDGCWLWTGTKQSTGYGAMVQWSGGKRLRRHVHRLSWEICRGPIPDGLYVLHKCDVKLCVNPDHLYLGTHLDNMRDEVERARSPRGERHYNAKLTSDQVKIIKNSRGVVTARSLAEAMNVTQHTVHSIWYGRHRKYE